jgi:hypothetical protein
MAEFWLNGDIMAEFHLEFLFGDVAAFQNNFFPL